MSRQMTEEHQWSSDNLTQIAWLLAAILRRGCRLYERCVSAVGGRQPVTAPDWSYMNGADVEKRSADVP
jgi:hypothetical protein